MIRVKLGPRRQQEDRDRDEPAAHDRQPRRSRARPGDSRRCRLRSRRPSGLAPDAAARRAPSARRRRSRPQSTFESERIRAPPLGPAGERVEVGELVGVDPGELHRARRAGARARRAAASARARRDSRRRSQTRAKRRRPEEREERVDRQQVPDADVVGRPDRGEEEDEPPAAGRGATPRRSPAAAAAAARREPRAPTAQEGERRLHGEGHEEVLRESPRSRSCRSGT